MLIVGDKEQELEQVAARRHKQGDLGVLPLMDFLALVQEEMKMV